MQVLLRRSNALILQGLFAFFFFFKQFSFFPIIFSLPFSSFIFNLDLVNTNAGVRIASLSSCNVFSSLNK